MDSSTGNKECRATTNDSIVLRNMYFRSTYYTYALLGVRSNTHQKRLLKANGKTPFKAYHSNKLQRCESSNGTAAPTACAELS